jgi:hypothetical protein
MTDEPSRKCSFSTFSMAGWNFFGSAQHFYSGTWLSLGSALIIYGQAADDLSVDYSERPPLSFSEKDAVWIEAQVEASLSTG